MCRESFWETCISVLSQGLHISTDPFPLNLTTVARPSQPFSWISETHSFPKPSDITGWIVFYRTSLHPGLAIHLSDYSLPSHVYDCQFLSTYFMKVHPVSIHLSFRYLSVACTQLFRYLLNE